MEPALKVRPFPDSLLRDLAHEHGTPLYVYCAERIAERVGDLSAFDVVRYAQKANANLSVLRLLRDLGVETDAVSAGEVRRALAAGFSEEQIGFAADLFDTAALEVLAKHDIRVNLGSADMIEQYASLRSGAEVTLRINPGFGHGHHRKVSTGGPQSKHGIWHRDLQQVLARVAEAGLRTTGAHVHIGSGSDFHHLSQVREALTRAALLIGDELRILSAGGGLPVPYRPGEEPFDVARYAGEWQETRQVIERELGHSVSLEVEPGRFLVAEAGVLLTEVRATKLHGELEHILVDAGFDNLLRPAMYGAYHHISVIGRDDEATAPRVLAGPLCESADMFTQRSSGFVEPRELPAARVGDLVCIHDAGAYAASMASNYNARPHAAEVLVEDGRPRLIRKRQTFAEMIASEIPLLE